MSSSHPTDAPVGPSRRAVILTGGAFGILAGLGAFRSADRADAAPVAPTAALAATAEERPHRTLLGVL